MRFPRTNRLWTAVTAVVFCSLCSIQLIDRYVTVKNRCDWRVFESSTCCEALFDGEPVAIEAAKLINIYPNDTPIMEQLADCDQYRRTYFFDQSSEEEREFPLAFSILLHKDLAHLDHLLRLIYRSQNFYCVHPDRKSIDLAEKTRKLAACFPNVIVPDDPLTVFWGGNGILNATILCLKELLKRSAAWRYFINLSVQDFPLMTNGQLVSVLKSWDGKSNVEMAGPANKGKFEYSHAVKLNRFGNPDSLIKTDRRKQTPMFNVTKGNLAAVLARPLAEWFGFSPDADRLFQFLNDTANPDEHFWQTAIANWRQFGLDQTWIRLQSPYMARYSLWRPSELCNGKFIRDVCVFGAGDLSRLSRLQDRYLFANKLYIGYQTPTYECMSRWYRTKLL